MAYQLLGLIWLYEWEKKELSPRELRYVMLHELAHKHLDSFKPTISRAAVCKLELAAQALATQWALAEKYTREELIKFEVDYWFLRKYGLRHHDFLRDVGLQR